MSDEANFDTLQRQMVVADTRVMHAMEALPRLRLFSFEDMTHAYNDHPMPIGFGQTISQPYSLYGRSGQHTGLDRQSQKTSENAAAVLSHLARTVHTVEVVKQLHLEAKGTLDAIIVAAGAPEVPTSLIDQLRVGGRRVMPVANGVNCEELL
ncbi:hypothetical protein EON65_19480 [archaeon]|nr:MAG: hypothetical protein EON65_19480 [archaeon]